MSIAFAAESIQSTQFAATRKELAHSFGDVFDPAAIARRIKEAREEMGLNQEEFADLLQVHKRTIGNWESQKKGERVTPFKEMHRIAEVTGKSMLWLLHGEDWLAAPGWEQIRNIEDKLDELLKRETAWHKHLVHDGNS